MKKIILTALILSFCFIPGMQISFAQEEPDLRLDGEYKILRDIGLIPDDIDEKITSEEYISRGEFAAVLSRAVNRSGDSYQNEAWMEVFWGEESIDEPAIAKEEASYYEDIDNTYSYAWNVNHVTDWGLMYGVGDKKFEPDDPISYGDAAKVFVSMLGYADIAERNGGYPRGYMNQAISLGFYHANTNSNLTYHDFVRLLYSVLDLEIFEVNISGDGVEYAENKNATFMSKWLEISYNDGIFTDNGITAVNGTGIGNASKIIVGDKQYSNKITYNISSLLGQKVRVYYSLAEDNKDDALSMYALSKNQVTEFDISDYISYNGNTVSYEANGRDKSLKVKSSVYMVYNGKYMSSWDSSVFDFSNGSVKVIDNGEWYDVIIVENYDAWVVSSHDTANKKIYNRAVDNDKDNAILDYTDAEENSSMVVYLCSGEECNVSDIKTNSVLDIIINGDYVKIIITDNAVSDFTVKSSEDEDGEAVISNGEEAYPISGVFYGKRNRTDIAVGKTYTLYLNKDGKVVWASLGDRDKYTVGYLIKTLFITDDEETVKVKIFNENGIFVNAFNAENVIYKENSYEQARLDCKRLYTKLKGYTGLVRYRLTEDGKLNYIEVASDTVQGDDYLQRVYTSGSNTLIYKSSGSYGWFGAELYVNSGTKVFVIPQSEEYLDSEDYYSIADKSNYVYDNYYAVSGYALDGETRIADYMIEYKDSLTSLKRNSRNFVFVDSIYKGIDANDELCTIINGWSFSDTAALKTVTLYAKHDKKDSSGKYASILEMADDTLNTGQKYEIQKGDIIRCSYSGANNDYIENCDLFFRLEGENPESPNGPKGFLAGSIGYYDNNPTIVGNTSYTFHPYSNPYTFSKEGVYSSGLSWMSGNFRTFYGYAYKLNQGVITATTQDITTSTFTDSDSRYKVDYQVLPSRTVVIDKVDGKYNLSAGNASNVRDWQNYGADCTRIIHNVAGGVPQVAILINCNE